jgi:hypothetical protein
MIEVYGARRVSPARTWAIRLVLLSPLLLAVTAAILLGLLGIFVAWLCVFWALAATIVASDIVHHSARRLGLRPITPPNRSAA